MFFRKIIDRIKPLFSDSNSRRTAAALRKIAEYEKQHSAKRQSLALVQDDYTLALYNVQMAFVKMVSTQIQGYKFHTQCPPRVLAEDMEEMYSELEKHKQQAKSAFDKLSPEYQERVILEKLSED